MGSKKFLYLFFAGVILLIIIFNLPFIQDIFLNYYPQRISINDGINYEFFTENAYQKILKFENPFITDSIFYPFKTNLSLDDTWLINFFPLTILRPFFNIHQSTLIIVLTNIFWANICMYLLLRKLKIRSYVSAFCSLIFAFSPFLSYRILGHYTYTTYYFFPLLFINILFFLESNSTIKKSIYSLTYGILLALTYFANPYYFLMVVLAMFFYCVYYLFLSFKQIFYQFIIKNVFYLLLSLLSFFVILTPWFLTVLNLRLFNEEYKVAGFGGAIELSSDLINFVTPSEYNPFYASIMNDIRGKSIFFAKLANSFFFNNNRSVSPGLIIITAYILIFLFKNKIHKKIWYKLKPHFLASLFFALLTLGPFLKIFNRWFITLDEGIHIFLPLPFLLLHYFPGLTTVRAPARFISAFVFFATIVTAYLLSFVFSRLNRKFYFTIFTLLFIVVVIDQAYFIPQRSDKYLPLKIYDYIKKDPDKSTVLEIPFTVRDGFKYIGSIHANTPTIGTLIHDKPIIGGYLSRVDSSIFSYYSNLPFIGHTAQIIDKGNYDLYKEQPTLPIVTVYNANVTTLQKELDFLDIKYVVLKNDELYSQLIRQTLEEIGYKIVSSETPYILLKRELRAVLFTDIRFGTTGDELFIVSGFSVAEDGFRWTYGKIATVFVKTINRIKPTIIFETESFQNEQYVQVYLDEVYIDKIRVLSQKGVYRIDVPYSLEPEIHRITFKLSKTHKPSTVFPDNKDERELGLKFYSLKIE